jgi:hypothetical protein
LSPCFHRQLLFRESHPGTTTEVTQRSHIETNMEKTMLRALFTAASILAIGSFGAISAQAAPTASRAAIQLDSALVAVHYTHVKHARRHGVRESHEITSFSSSTAPATLNVGVNHPPKK